MRGRHLGARIPSLQLWAPVVTWAQIAHHSQGEGGPGDKSPTPGASLEDTPAEGAEPWGQQERLDLKQDLRPQTCLQGGP